jgi:hypothetical protein
MESRPPAEAGPGGTFELRISTTGKGSGIISDNESPHRIYCDSECVKGCPLCAKTCAMCAAQYPAGTQVPLQLRSRQPSIATAWSDVCGAGATCTVALNNDRDLQVDLQIEGADHLEAVFPDAGLPLSVVGLGADLYAVGVGCRACEVLNGALFLRDGLYYAKMEDNGRWTTPQFVGDGWSAYPPAFWTLTDLIVTSGGDLAGVIRDGVSQFAFVGKPGGPFKQLGLESNSSPIFCLRDGFVAGDVSVPSPGGRSVRFDLAGQRVSTYEGFGLSPNGDRAFPADGTSFFVTRYASAGTLAVSKINGAGAALWTANLVALQSMNVISDGADGLLVVGEFSGDLNVGGTMVRSPANAAFVARLSGSDGSARWVRTYEATRRPFTALVGTALYIGASIQDASIGTRVGDNLMVRGTAFVARVDLTTSQPVWANPIAYDVKNVAATSAAVWVQSPGTLYRFRP